MKQNGFTLIEVLVAFTIMAVALVALMQAFSSGLLNLDTAQRYVTATLQARSALDQIGPVIALEAGEHGGELGNGSKWRAVVEPQGTSASGFDEAPRLQPYNVAVTVTWRGEQAVTLRTLRLANEQ